MVKNIENKVGPLVSVLIPTFNRPLYLQGAITSVLRQSYKNLQLIVVNDGGEDISDIVNSFDDNRLMYINRKENLGKAFSLNEALARAEGKYIAYLDDDDIHYPNHIDTLVNILENQTDCQVAYSDLYQTFCRIMPDGKRQVLSKVVEISRDFDRLFMLCFNHVLHVSLMHRRDLLEKTGLYNENLNVLIDWDITRRMAFFTDFYHSYEVTGEFYHCSGKSDRISIQLRKNKKEFARNVLAIRTTRPAKPWPKIKDLSIIFNIDKTDKQAGKTLGLIWRHTFYPYQIYLPLLQDSSGKLDTDMPNIITVPVNPGMSETEQIDAALARCEGELIAIVPNGFPIRQMWIEDSLYALINSSIGQEGFELEGSTDSLWAVLLEKDCILNARRTFPNLSVRESLKAAGITIRRIRPEEIAFQLDCLLEQGRAAQRNNKWAQAAEIFEYIAENYQNQLWMKSLAAKAFFKAGDRKKAAELSFEINRQRPTVNTLLLEAKLTREKKDFHSAIELLERAQKILEEPSCGCSKNLTTGGKELLWT